MLEYSAELDRTLVEVKIETGRKHQIRKHLLGAGFPIVGDRLYGSADGLDLQLASTSLSFCCPMSGEQKAYSLAGQLRIKI